MSDFAHTWIGLRGMLCVAGGVVLAAAALGEEKMAPKKPVLRHSDVVFMYAADSKAYQAYGATFVGWGGANTARQVKRHHEMGIRCTGSMWCLTAGAKLIHDDPKLRAACAVDIEGKPIEVPWQFDHTYKGTKTYFGCTNHPAFRKLNRDRVRQVMAGGADGLHVDDHLGVASPAWWHGGGLCDHCIAAFREYLKTHATKPQLAAAGVKDLGAFDYRDLIRKHAKTRAQYKKVQRRIPLMKLFLAFHAEAAAENVRQLGEVAAEAAGHRVLLSANAGLPSQLHTHVLQHLTHVICEVGQNAPSGTRNVRNAVRAYQQAAALGKPIAATAGGHDWAYVKEHKCEELVRFWIALAYAHGQRFMVPHPKRQWCFNRKLGTHWYAAPVEAYAPLYRFIRANAKWFDGFEAVEARGLTQPRNVLCTVRREATGRRKRTVVHVLNRNYDAAAQRMKPATNVKISLPKFLAPAGVTSAKLLSYDAEPAAVPVITAGKTLGMQIPELRLWTLVALE